MESKEKWFRNRGYLHLSPKLNLEISSENVFRKVKNPNYVKRHAFFPLIHSIIKERRLKTNKSTGRPSHTDHLGKSTAKIRPLHFASHLDSMIFGHYADILKTHYENILQSNPAVSECITAYRQIPLDENKNKSTIHFAHEAFETIKQHAIKDGECVVLKFDIEKYFSSIDHELLKKSWCDLLGTDHLPVDHYKVFRASTKFSYILKDDLRKGVIRKGRKQGFDERELAQNRKLGVESFFGSAREFRESIKNGRIKIYKNPFYRKEDKKAIGIPQGLPISAILANIYLLEFDKKIVEQIVTKRNGFYRRYSDDIIVVVQKEDEDWANDFVNNMILERNVRISKEKTEIFHFKKISDDQHITVIKGYLKKGEQFEFKYPLNYLGFDFYGDKTLIAAKNLSKFYRRMKVSIKKKVKIASKKSLLNDCDRSGTVVFNRQLYRIYTNQNLTSQSLPKRRKRLVKNIYGFFHFKVDDKLPAFKGNYLTYIKRAAKIMNEPAIQNQLRNHKKIFNQYLKKRIEIEKQKIHF